MTGARLWDAGTCINQTYNLANEKTDVGVQHTGVMGTVKGTTVNGGNIGLMLDGSSSLTVLDLVTCDQYGVGLYTRKPTSGKLNTSLHVYGFKGAMHKKGMHIIRLYHLEGFMGRDFYLEHDSGYGGATGNFRQVKTVRMTNINAKGQPFGFGPDPTEVRENGYSAEDIIIEGGTWDFVSQITFWPNARKITLRGMNINVQKNSVFNIAGSVLGRPIASEILIDNCIVTAPPGVKFATGDWSKSAVKNTSFNTEKAVKV